MGFNTDCPKPVISTSRDEITKNITALCDRAKKLPKARVMRTCTLSMLLFI